MIEFILAGAAAASILLNKRLSDRVKKLQEEIFNTKDVSNVIKDLCTSLESDDHWYFKYSNPKEGTKIEIVENKKSSVSFTIIDCQINNQRYPYGCIFEPFLRGFSLEENHIVSDAVEVLRTKKLRNARMKMIDEEIKDAEKS